MGLEWQAFSFLASLARFGYAMHTDLYVNVLRKNSLAVHDLRKLIVFSRHGTVV